MVVTRWSLVARMLFGVLLLLGGVWTAFGSFVFGAYVYVMSDFEPGGPAVSVSFGLAVAALVLIGVLTVIAGAWLVYRPFAATRSPLMLVVGVGNLGVAGVAGWLIASDRWVWVDWLALFGAAGAGVVLLFLFGMDRRRAPVG